MLFTLRPYCGNLVLGPLQQTSLGAKSDLRIRVSELGLQASDLRFWAQGLGLGTHSRQTAIKRSLWHLG